ncbi:acyl-CoA dehydrogenase, partial [Pseudomonas syringae]|nr:acyl-CoA dehydrogenase [Pseudomonas syringae]
MKLSPLRQHRELSESAADFATRLEGITATLAETAEHYDASGAFPHANFALLHSHGLL